jgi:probable rRNA maturation factor
MIAVEADVSWEWDGAVDWAALAGRSVQAAFDRSGRSGLGDSEVSVKFTSDDEVRALNATWRGKDKPTNVLSFPMVEAGQLGAVAAAGPGEILLGDIVLAHGICAAEAAAKDIPIEDHAAHLVVHGSLHLLGYDHEGDKREAEAMETAEREALAALGIADPYLSVRS